MRYVIGTIAALLVVAGMGFGLAYAFDTPTYLGYKHTGPALYNVPVSFGIINETGTTDAIDLGDVYPEFSCEFTRTGTGDMVVGLQCSEYNLSFANIIEHTIQVTNTNTYRAVTASSSGRKCRFLKFKVASGTDALYNTITNTICAGHGRGR
jgi:hypothetical protein